jgi:hypothetical protein
LLKINKGQQEHVRCFVPDNWHSDWYSFQFIYSYLEQEIT